MKSDEMTLFGKRTLIDISHAIERFALGADPSEPLIVIAMFQRLSYFRREVAAYTEIAARSAVTIVGLVEDFPPQLPRGVQHHLVSDDDPLALEWSVTVLGPRGGATLVAIDQEAIDPNARTLEEGRRFVGYWSFRRDDAYQEVVRLRAQLSLSPETAAKIDTTLRAVLALPEPVHQDWLTIPIRFMATRMANAVRGRSDLQGQLDELLDPTTERDPRTGLYNQKFLDRWTRGLGIGTLPIGLVLLRVFGVSEIRSRYGLRAELAMLNEVRTSLENMITDADRIVRLSRDDFLVVLPSWQPENVARFCDTACAEVARLDERYPFVALPSVASGIVTRDRPLPLAGLLAEVQNNARVNGPHAVRTP